MKEVKEKILYKGNWISLKQTTYNNDKGEEVNWESIERTNTCNTVVIIPKLVPSNRYLIIKQYRPAINNCVLGFPAGLLEANDVEKEALRELKEETGYTGKVLSISPILYSNAALLTDTVRVVNIEIDETIKENLNPKQQLESAEEIEVLLVEEKNLKSFILEQQKKGTAIGMGIWYIFCEIQNAK